MRLGLTTTTIGDESSIWDSAHRRFLTGGITIDYTSVTAVNGERLLNAGQVMGKDGSTGKYKPLTDKVAASKETGVIADNNRIKWTAVEKGTIGNAIKVALVDPSANSAALAVSVLGDTISVSLATGSTGTITSTALEVIAAVNAHLVAKDLVLAAGVTGSTGAAAVAAVAATALAGGTDWNVTPSCMLAENVDCTDGDICASAVDQARVRAARLPAVIQDEVKAVLTGITIV